LIAHPDRQSATARVFRGQKSARTGGRTVRWRYYRLACGSRYRRSASKREHKVAVWSSRVLQRVIANEPERFGHKFVAVLAGLVIVDSGTRLLHV
jgi:hypothetical protein